MDKDQSIEQESGGNETENIGLRNQKTYGEWEQMNG